MLNRVNLKKSNLLQPDSQSKLKLVNREFPDLNTELMREKLLNWLNLALTANLFLVLLSFFWLAIAVVGKMAGVPLGLDLWYKLWEPLFTPAIGLLMAGAIISGIVSWVNKKLNSAT